MYTPPGPKGEPGLGNTRQFARHPLAFMEACRDAYGDLAWFSLGPYEGVLLTDPAAIEQVLVSEAATYRKPTYLPALTATIGEGLVLGNGSTWRAQRERAQMPFSLSRIVRRDNRTLRRRDGSQLDPRRDDRCPPRDGDAHGADDRQSDVRCGTRGRAGRPLTRRTRPARPRDGRQCEYVPPP